MEKLFLVTYLILGICMTGFSQEDSNFVISRNEAYTGYTETGSSVTVTDVYSKLSKYKRKIVIADSNSVGIGTAYIRVEDSTTNENVYDKISKNSSNFSGTLYVDIAIPSGHLGDTVISTIYKMRISLGVVTNINYMTPVPVYDASLTCTMGHIHDCVAYVIEGMNWVDYLFCVATAPICYAQTWLSCDWEVCHRHMRYTNPN